MIHVSGRELARGTSPVDRDRIRDEATVMRQRECDRARRFAPVDRNAARDPTRRSRSDPRRSRGRARFAARSSARTHLAGLPSPSIDSDAAVTTPQSDAARGRRDHVDRSRRLGPTQLNSERAPSEQALPAFDRDAAHDVVPAGRRRSIGAPSNRATSARARRRSADRSVARACRPLPWPPNAPSAARADAGRGRSRAARRGRRRARRSAGESYPAGIRNRGDRRRHCRASK